MADQRFYLLLDNLRSIFNVGAIFRTAEAAGIDKIYLGGITSLASRQTGKERERELNIKIHKTALGAEKIVPWEHCWQSWRIVEKLKKEDFFIVALEQTKKSICYTKLRPKFPLLLIVGNEVKGVCQSLLKRADKIIYLPMYGKKESLNVAVATGIAIYEINKFRKLKIKN
ncbi:MAG: TrmH family RNA methyltransferase [Patescibacteria group bacterium]|nr:TrmH family RNA methyltransferase [Patescibacteria group bacterium]